MQKIIIAIDSFKGCLSSIEVAQACKKGIHNTFPNCNVVIIPIADGGEGTLETLVEATAGTYRTINVHNPLMKLIPASYGILGDDNKTAVIEMAKASGLTLIPQSSRNPLVTTTFGTGELIRDAILSGCETIMVGIGGSATNDAGLGMLQALGFRFYDSNKKLLGVGGKIMAEVAFMDDINKMPQLKNVKFKIACDVNNPFFGVNGAAQIYGPQKGATSEIVQQLDKGLENINNLVKANFNIDLQSIPGSGAAGGLGGGFMAFLNATLESGIQVVLETMKFEEQLLNANLIITGEGKLDEQTLMGKAPQGILAVAKRRKIPLIAIAGSIENPSKLNKGGMSAVFSITPYPVSLEKAMEKDFSKSNIENTVTQLMNVIKLTQNKQI